MPKIEASDRLRATQDKEDAERYRAIRDQVLKEKTLTLKSPGKAAAFDSMIDNVLRRL